MAASIGRLASKTVWGHLPAAAATIENLGEISTTSSLEASLLELVNLRCSQLNGCAYCVQYHTDNLNAANEPAHRITLLPAGRKPAATPNAKWRPCLGRGGHAPVRNPRPGRCLADRPGRLLPIRNSPP